MSVAVELFSHMRETLSFQIMPDWQDVADSADARTLKEQAGVGKYNHPNSKIVRVC